MTKPARGKIHILDGHAATTRMLATARDEGWEDLAIFGQSPAVDVVSYALPPRAFVLATPSLATHVEELASLHKLRYLHLYDKTLGSIDIRTILSAMHSLRSLTLRIGELDTECMVSLARSLPALTSLGLPSHDLGPERAIAIAESVRGLTSLNLSRNRLGTEGAIAILHALRSQALTSLDLSGNQLGSDAAVAISRLTGLTSLVLWNNMIEDSGAIAISQSLKSLGYLDLAGNGIGARGAVALARSLSSLEWLDLSANRIGDEGAVAIAESLPALTALGLNRCGIRNTGALALAKSLKSLRLLKLSGNTHLELDGIRQLLDAIDRWTDKGRRLNYLDISHCQDLSSLFPEELVQEGNAQALLSAYRRETAPLNEVKLLVIGNEAVGKTSLIRYLKDGEPRNAGELKTPGIVVNEKIAVAKWAPTKSQVAVNIWDFGGQEIMHGTHRYFLTKRSLYVVVLEARREDSQDEALDHWLRVIKDRGGDSPVVVVVNKAEPEHLYHPNEELFRGLYSNVANFARTTCNAGDADRIQRVREQIITVIEQDPRLRHVRDRIPVAWLDVKRELEQLASQQKTVTYEEYVRLCDGANRPPDRRVTESTEQKGLLRLLNDLGVVIAHGIDTDAAASMREVTLLDPNWLTQAIYRVLNSPRLRERQGVFEGGRLDQFLDTRDYPPERFEFIVDMMQHPEIGLCFELPDERGSYLVPEALPNHEPDGLWPEQEPLRFCYVYGLLPSGLVPRLIVLGHTLLSADRLGVWKEGAIFNVDSCKVLVRGDRVRRRIDLFVFGPKHQRRQALGVMRNYLSRVHALHKALEEQPRVPLPDKPETTVSYQYLVEREQEKGSHYTWKPEGADREYAIGELLDGVRAEADPAPSTAMATETKEYRVAGIAAFGAVVVALVGLIGGLSSQWLADTCKEGERVECQRTCDAGNEPSKLCSEAEWGPCECRPSKARHDIHAASSSERAPAGKTSTSLPVVPNSVSSQMGNGPPAP